MNTYILYKFVNNKPNLSLREFLNALTNQLVSSATYVSASDNDSSDESGDGGEAESSSTDEKFSSMKRCSSAKAIDTFSYGS